MLKISVLIITRNKDKDLDECLKSISNQSAPPFEVVVVDNDSSDSTRSVCKKHKKTLPIKYFLEKRIGIPYARNKSIRKASGDTFAFIDDDCIAKKNWLKTIQTNFVDDKELDAIVGLTRSYFTKLVPLVEQFYYERWVLLHVDSLTKKSLMKNARFFDFKNCAVRARVFAKMPSLFSYNVPFGDVGDEDIEYGTRLSKYCKRALFNPKVRVYHKNSQALVRLANRNFYNGVSSFLLRNKGVDLEKKFIKKRWRKMIVLSPRHLRLLDTLIEKVSFLILVLVFPIFYKVGKIYGQIQFSLNRDYTLPPR
ncbi:glycosyltransferase family 2 protein [Patescibacteria group bacterium]|nr:glycosyltransferase family 2 protein [Patescibacteria group bacterium]